MAYYINNLINQTKKINILLNTIKIDNPNNNCNEHNNYEHNNHDRINTITRFKIYCRMLIRIMGRAFLGSINGFIMGLICATPCWAINVDTSINLQIVKILIKFGMTIGALTGGCCSRQFELNKLMKCIKVGFATGVLYGLQNKIFNPMKILIHGIFGILCGTTSAIFIPLFNFIIGIYDEINDGEFKTLKRIKNRKVTNNKNIT